MDFHVEMTDALARFPEYRLDEPVNWEIKAGENWGVIGPNGAGKTLLIDMLQGKIALRQGEVKVYSRREKPAYELIRSMTFRDIYSLADCKTMYYQQRWNATDTENVPFVRELLKEYPEELLSRYVSLFGITEFLDKRLIFLSSGELRKFLIVRTLLAEPQLLILDNPFIGLDEVSRTILCRLLEQMKEINGLQFVLVVANPADLPESVNFVLPMKDRRCYPSMTLADFKKAMHLQQELFGKENPDVWTCPSGLSAYPDFKVAVKMEAVCVKYGQHYLLKGVDWEIRRGEKWALLGPNGCGKSTLLSLVCGDNPQAYANRIFLFDRLRGSGESIWDIKKRIGYLSPDMHTYYLEDIPCREVVASGFFDSIGLFRKCNERQQRKATEWMKLFKADELAERSFVKISYGEQRLVLLIRALVKNPDLLILDEPLHGLDTGRKKRALAVIEKYCEQENATLIYVTHYRNEIPACVSRFKVLEEATVKSQN